LADLDARYDELVKNARELASITGMSDAQADAYITQQAGKEGAKIRAEQDAIVGQIDEWETKQAQVNEQIDATKEKLATVRSEQNNVSSSFKDIGENTKKSVSVLDEFTRRVKGLAKRVLIFSVITRVLNQFRQYLGSLARGNEDLMASLANLKGALMTAFAPIWEFIVPWLKVFINVLASAAQTLASFTAKLFGKSLDDTRKSAKGLNKELGKTSGAASKASKSLASFDTINKLNEASGGGGAGGANFGFDAAGEMGVLETLVAGSLLALGVILLFAGQIPLGIALIALGASALVNVSDVTWGEVGQKLKEVFSGVLGLLIGGALLVLGIILTATGHFGLGLALIIAGCAALYAEASLNWDSIEEALKKPIAATLGLLVGGVLVILGMCLAFSGVAIGLGIGLIAAGAAALVTEAALNWSEMKEQLKSSTGVVIALLVGVTLLAVGMVLAFSGVNLGLGIALMVVGAAALVTEAALNWNKIVDFLHSDLALVLGLCVGGALLAIGLLLAFSGANLPLGIALAIVGAATLVSAVALNWDRVKEIMQTKLGAIVGICVGSALLAVGLILALSGVNLPLGIALIAAGVGALGFVAAVNWDAIKEKCKEIWDGIKAWFNESVAPKLTIDYWKEKFSGIAEGLKAKIKDGINSAIALFNKFIDWVNEKLDLSWNGINIAGQQIVPAGKMKLLNIPHIPMLAQGAVIPANHEFLSILGDQKAGTNIETPLSTMIEAFKQAQASQAININFTGDLAQLAYILAPEISKEGARVGQSMVNFVR
ncbi:MAG: hypothetical protein KBS75_09135, partial [Bacteroidales bacterium]|nr:hypothetical protein [Candidatus Equimonas faecalis]